MRDKAELEKSTTYIMVRRLSNRGVVKNENAMVSSLVKQKHMQKYEAETVVDKIFDGSLLLFVRAFLSDKSLCEDEADGIIGLVRDAVK